MKSLLRFFLMHSLPSYFPANRIFCEAGSKARLTNRMPIRTRGLGLELREVLEEVLVLSPFALLLFRDLILPELDTADLTA